MGDAFSVPFILSLVNVHQEHETQTKYLTKIVNCFKLVLLNLLQFGNMIQCSTNRSMWDYYDYGCWCGFGGSGRPVDGTDRYHSFWVLEPGSLIMA